MDFSNLGLTNATEYTAIVAVVGLIIQVLKRKTSIPTKYLPWLSIALGAVTGIAVLAWYGDSSYLGGGILGALLGASTSGLFDGLQTPVNSAVSAFQSSKEAKLNKAVQAVIDAQATTSATTAAEVKTDTDKSE